MDWVADVASSSCMESPHSATTKPRFSTYKEMNAIALCKNLIIYQVCSMRHVSHMFLGSTWKSCRWNHFWMHAIEMLWFAILFQGFKCVISWFEFSSTQTFILEWHSICKHYLKHGSPYQLFLWFLCWCNGWFSVQKRQIV